MNPGYVQSRFINALRTQGKAEYPVTSALPCPYPGHHGRIFQSVDQLFDHAKAEHNSEIVGIEPRLARAQLKDAALKLRRSDQSSDATAGDRSAPDITSLSLEAGKEPRQSSPSSGKKRRAAADDDFHGRRGKAPSHVVVADADFSRQIPYTIASDRNRPKSQDHRFYDHKQAAKETSFPYQPTPEPSSEWSVEAAKSAQLQSTQLQSPARQLPHRTVPKLQYTPRQPGLIELQRYDPRYPGLLLQPDSRPISQEQLASEVKSIYAGLTMVDSPQYRQKYVPISTKGNHIEAFPDTGSGLDIISYALSTQLNLKLDKAHVLTIQTPTGRKIRTLGTAELEIAFRGEKSRHKRTFHVLERSVHEMILGKSFLDTTETLTKFAHRIKSRLGNLVSRIPRLHLIGSVTERVIGSINGTPTTAVDDTGSDVMVISWKEAERLGLQITTEHSHRTILEFVDGEEIYTDGAILNVDWRFGYNTAGKAIKVNIQVVRDLTCNLILSNEMLFQANTYNNPGFFLTEEQEIPIHNDHASLCLITDRSKRKRALEFLVKWFHSQPAETDVEDSKLIIKAERVLDEEVARQLYEEERINCLRQDERDAAWAEEHELQRKWKQSHTALNAVPPALRTSNQPFAPCSVPSSDPSLPTSTRNETYPSSPKRIQRAGWKQFFPSTRLKKANDEIALS